MSDTLVNTLSPEQSDQLQRDLASYVSARSRAAATLLVSTGIVFAALFALQRRSLLLPALLGMAGFFCWSAYRDRRRRVRCPLCRACVMPPLSTRDPTWLVTAYCSECGVGLDTRYAARAARLDEAARERYWNHDRVHFFPRPLGHYILLALSAVALACSLVPGWRGPSLLAFATLLVAVLSIRRYRKNCPACRRGIYDLAAPYCSSCGSRLAPVE